MIFNKKNNDEEILSMLNEIRDAIEDKSSDADLMIAFMDNKISDSKNEVFNEIEVLSTSINNHNTLINGHDDNITTLLNEVEMLQAEIYNQKAINKKLQNQVDWCIQSIGRLSKIIEFKNKEKSNNKEDYLADFIKKYKSQNYGKPYTGRNMIYDGFYFKANGGRGSGQVKFDIMILNELNNNLKNIIRSIAKGEKSISKYCDEYNISKNIMPRLLYNLADTDYFDSYLAELNRQHLYEIKDGLIYIDNHKTGMSAKDIAYMKTCLVNSNNPHDTVKNFMGYFKEIKNKYIRILALNIDKLPSKWFDETTDVTFENNPQKRKEKGMI